MGSTEDWLTALGKKKAASVGAALSLDQSSPDDVASAIDTGKALGIPASVVSSAPDVFARQKEQARLSELLSDAPQTAAWLQKGQNGSLGKDDVDNLSWFEKQLKPFASIGGPDGGLGVVSGVGRAVARGAKRTAAITPQMRAAGSAQVLADYGKSLDDLIADELAQVGGEKAPASMRVPAMQAARLRFDAAQGLSEEDRATMLQEGADDLKAAQDALNRAAAVEMSPAAAAFRDGVLATAENTLMGALGAFANDPAGGAAFIAETAAEFLPQMVVGAGVTAATRSPAAGALTMGIGSGLTENTTGAMEYLAENGVDLSTPEAAAAVLENAELMQGAADRGLTRGLIIGLMDAISGGVAGQTLLSSPAGDVVAQGLAQAAFGAGGEGLAQAASGQEIDWRDIVVEGLAEIATAPAEVLGVGGRGFLKDAQAAETAGRTAEILDAIDGAASKSKLRQRAPDSFAELLREQGHGDLYVDAETLKEYFQSSDMAPGDWGIDPEALDERAMSGQYAAIPIPTYAERISGTDAAQWVRDNAVSDPNELSVADAEAFNASVRDVLEQVREEAEADAVAQRAMRAADVQIYDETFSQLRAAGRSPDVAENEARVMAAFWRTMGERYGEDPLDLARSMGLRIQGPQSDVAGRKRGDVDILLNTLRAGKDVPQGDSLVEFVRTEGGVRDDGGDVEALELPKGVVAETRAEVQERTAQPTLGAMPSIGKGIGLDEMARKAKEAGYFADVSDPDANALLDALAEEAAGRAVYRAGEGVDPALADLRAELDARGIDLALSNDEIVAALTAQDGQQYDQSGILTRDDVDAFAKSVKDELGLRDLSIFLSGDTLKLNMIAVQKGEHGRGAGSEAMRRIVDFADLHGKTIALTPGLPDDGFGTTSRARLVKFYKRFGFVENKGRNKDFTISEGMYREPNRTLYQEGGSQKRGSIVLPQGGLAEGQTVINLFESADLSTFLHESGHYFLEAFTALATSPEAPQAMRDDLAVIHDFLGVDGGAALTRDQHETWARGFEAYLMEGKAPSLDLASSFSRFKAWLTRIYRTAKGLNVKINQEIREVMDRMLATEAEIQAAREEAGMSALFREAPAGMTAGDFKTYQRLARRSTEAAEQRLLDKTMAKIRREREAWFKEEKAAVTKEVTERVNSMPVYRLTEALANQRWLGSDADVADMRIDRAALVEMFGPGVIDELSRSQLGGKRAVYMDGGEDPAAVADFFGFRSATDMVSALQNAGKRKDAITAEVDRVMTERHGDPLNDGTIEEEALQAIHNDQQAQTVAAEARHLASQAGRNAGSIKAQVFKARAKAILGRMTVREAAKSHMFLAAERKAAKTAEKAFARVARGGGQQAIAEAAQAKEQQLLNQMLYRESLDFAAKLQRGREKMRAYSKKSVREKLEGGYIEQIDAILERFDFRKRTLGQVAKTESLAAYIDRMIADGREAELAIDQRLVDEARREHYTRLTVDELRGLFDTIDNIDHMGRFKQKLIEAKRRRDLNESASHVAAAVRASQKPSSERRSGIGLKTLNLLRKPDTVMISLDGGEEMGAVYDELKLGIDAGQAKEQAMQVEMADKFEALFDGHYSRDELRAMVKARAIPGVGNREWSKQEIIALALNMGAADNHQRVMDQSVDPELRMNKQTLDALLGTLSENDWRFVQGMWDMVNGYWPDLAAVHKRRTGVEPEKVQPQLMYDKAPAFVRGGYYPIKYDPTRGKAAARDEASAWDKFLTAGHGSTTAVNNGMTKQRQKSSGGRTIMYDLNVPFQHLRETIRFIALSEAVDNSYKILNHNDVVDAMQDTGNEDTHKALNLWLKDTAQGPIYNNDPLNTAARFVKNNFTISRLAFNMKTVLLQVTGLGQSAATIGKKNMLLGMADFMRNPSELIAEVTSKSAFMAERETTFQKDIYDFKNDVKVQSPLAGRWSRANRTLAQAGFWPMVKMQFLAVDMPTWLGAYRAGIDKYKGNEDRAVLYADRMVARAQDSGMFGDRAAVERGTVSENVRQADFIRLFTTLGGYMLTKLNRIQATGIQAKAGIKAADTATGKAAVAVSAATDLTLLIAFEPLLMALAYAALTDDEDDEDIAKFLVSEMGLAVVGGVPVLRDMASAFRGYGGGGIYGSVLEMPYKAGVQVMQGENDRALRRSIGDIVGTVTGLPTTAALRAYEGILGDDDAPMSEVLLGSNPLNR